MTLTDFLLARIAEDEARFHAHVRSEREEYGAGLSPEHVAEQDKALARVLAECKARRRIVELHRPRGEDDPAHCCTDPDAPRLGERMYWGEDDPCLTLLFLALTYADHPDCRDEWKP